VSSKNNENHDTKFDALFIKFKSKATQIYVAFKQNNDQSLSGLTTCMALNFPCNLNKTEEIVFWASAAVSGNTD